MTNYCSIFIQTRYNYLLSHLKHQDTQLLFCTQHDKAHEHINKIKTSNMTKRGFTVYITWRKIKILTILPVNDKRTNSSDKYVLVNKPESTLLTSDVDNTIRRCRRLHELSIGRSYIIRHCKISHPNDRRNTRHIWSWKCCNI